jgi:translin
LGVIKLNEGLVEQIRGYLDRQEKIREEILDSSRKVIRLSSRTIAAIHRKEDEKAGEFLSKAREELAALIEIIRDQPQLFESGLVMSAQQEYGEAAIFRSLVNNGKLLTPEEVGIPYKPYLFAISDLCGEVRRYALDSIRSDDVQTAERMLSLLEDIFTFLMEFDYPDAVLPGMKRRQDMVRKMLELTRGDVTLAVRQLRLENALKKGQ